MGIIGPELKNQTWQINMTLNEWSAIMDNRGLRKLMYAQKHQKQERQDVISNDMSKYLREAWGKACVHLQNELQPISYNTWIRPIQAVEDGGRLLLVVPNDFHNEIVENRYLSLIMGALNNVAGESVTVEVVTNK